MKKRILTLLLALVFVFSLASFSVSAEDKTIRIADKYVEIKDPGLMIDLSENLTEEEQEKLSEQFLEISKRLDFAVTAVLIENLPDGYTEETVADTVYDEMGYDYGENRDGCLLLYITGQQRVYLRSVASGKDIIDPKLDEIFDEIGSDLKSGNYYKAFSRYAELCDNYVTDAHKFPIVRNVLICLGIGLIVALLAVLVMRSQLKSVKPQNLANDYLKDGSLNVTEARDLYLYSHISKTKIERESSGGSSGGSSSRGGGGRSL